MYSNNDRLTERQRQILDLYNQLGTDKKVAEELGITRTGVTKTRNAALRKLEADDGVIDAMSNAGLKNYDNVHSGWLKTDEASIYFVNPKVDDEQREDLVETFKEAFKDAPKSFPTAAPTDIDDELLSKYILADLHMGMRAWEPEAGDNYDLDIAVERLQTTFSTLVRSTPNSKIGLIENLGDTFHANDHKNMTPGSGHILDSDGRFTKIMYETVKAVVTLVEELKEKHETVKYVGVSGNHDVDANHYLTIALMMRFHDDPRVDIIWNPAKMWSMDFGNVLLAAHHGDRVKPERLAMQLADDFAPLWGKTKWRYLDTGHIHHDSSKDIGGVFWESHRTLASRDAYATGAGYVSRSTLKSVTYHKERGEIIRNTVGV